MTPEKKPTNINSQENKTGGVVGVEGSDLPIENIEEVRGNPKVIAKVVEMKAREDLNREGLGKVFKGEFDRISKVYQGITRAAILRRMEFYNTNNHRA